MFSTMVKSSGVHLDIYPSYVNKQATFFGQKYLQEKIQPWLKVFRIIFILKFRILRPQNAELGRS